MVAMALGFEDRIFASWMVWWKKDDGEILLAFTPMEDLDDKEVVQRVGVDLLRHEGAQLAVIGTMKVSPRVRERKEDVSLCARGGGRWFPPVAVSFASSLSCCSP